MTRVRPRRNGWLLLFLVAASLSFAAGANPLDFLRKLPFVNAGLDIEGVQREFHEAFYDTGRLPEKVRVDDEVLRLSYTIKPELEEEITQLLKKYNSDFASVVVMDNNTGDILAAIDMARGDGRPGRLATFSPTHPAASVFKIVTAADLLENTHVGNETQFRFAGRSTTLYKSQLKQADGRWARKTDFEHAFAKSNNVIFGKAALENLSPSGLKKMAEKFGFNRSVVPFLRTQPSVFPMAVDQYNLAELASGLNVSTMISPVHGALIASVVANGGVMRQPVLLKGVATEGGLQKWESAPVSETVVGPDTAADLRRMMIATIAEGTARRAFRRLPASLVNLEVGGKTGSITGGEPYGKRDWFVAYARDASKPEDRGLSICVMIVNKKKWYVKSTQLTREILELVWGNSGRAQVIRRKLWSNRT